MELTRKSEIHYRNKRKYVISTGMANHLLQQGHKLLEIKKNKRVKWGTYFSTLYKKTFALLQDMERDKQMKEQERYVN
ncbi:hypothetical protein [Bacillus sp. K6W]|uniref:hypothetical protein n=1 Tax=Bacillus sp. K6W TaxID=2249215 RepID=UPI000DF79AF9|nr:hypothetical protein [Bacillus sp. K6W]